MKKEKEIKYAIQSIERLERELKKAGWEIKERNESTIQITKRYKHVYGKDKKEMEELKEIIIEKSMWVDERAKEIIEIIRDYYIDYETEREIMCHIKKHNIELWSDAREVAVLMDKVEHDLFRTKNIITKEKKELEKASNTYLFKKLTEEQKLKRKKPYEILLLLQEADRCHEYIEIKEYDRSKGKYKESKKVLNIKEVEEVDWDKNLLISKIIKLNLSTEYYIEINSNLSQIEILDYVYDDEPESLYKLELNI